MTEQEPTYWKNHERSNPEKKLPNKNLVFHLALAGPIIAGIILTACGEKRGSQTPIEEPIYTPPTSIEEPVSTPVEGPLVRFNEVDENGDGIIKDGIINIIDLRLQRKGQECLACLDINASGEITQMDVNLIQRRIDDQELPFHPRFDPAEPFGKIDDKDVEAVKAEIGRIVPSEEGGLKLSEVYYGWVSNRLEVQIKPGTNSEEIKRLSKKYNLPLPSGTVTNAYITIPEEVLEKKTLGELIEELLQEESVSLVGRISTGTIE